MGQNKKKHNNVQINPVVPDYDLERSLGKINQKSNLSQAPTELENYAYSSKKDNRRFSPVDDQNLNDQRTNEGYNSFKEMMTLSQRLEDANKDLRKEADVQRKYIEEKVEGFIKGLSDSIEAAKNALEIKLESKVSEKLFYGAIAAVILIGTIVYVLYLDKMYDDVEEVTKTIETIKHDQIEIKKSNKDIITKFEKIQKDSI